MPYVLRGQPNLVPNPSFEKTNMCQLNHSGIDTIWYDDHTKYRDVQFWISPNYETPDYYNACQNDGGNYSVPSNQFGYQFAQEGQAYIGIIIYSDNKVFYPNGELREYIQAKLLDTFESGALYRSRFYISPSFHLGAKYNIIGTRNLSMALTRHQPQNTVEPISKVPTSNTTIILPPQIMDQSIAPTDTGAWYEICGLYRATGGERWLTIGNFHTRQNTLTDMIRPATDSVSAGITLAYYYIDNVSLVKVSDPIFVNRDTVVCQFPALVEARAGFSKYTWSTGDTTAGIMVPGPGEYRVRVWLPGECAGVEDTIRVSQVSQPPHPVLPDTALCPAALPLRLNAPPGFVHYEWSTGATGAPAEFATPGEYILRAYTTCAVLADTFHLSVLPEVPDFDLGDPINLCTNDRDVPQVLSPGVPLPVYAWSTGDTGPQITVARPGLYTLRSNTVCGEKQASVAVSGCPTQVYVPNIFSPNDDGYNDLFTISARNIGEATLSVFSRWGDLLYQETGADLRGWDGTARGRPVAAGAYVYLLVYRESNSGERQELRGTVTVVR